MNTPVLTYVQLPNTDERLQRSKPNLATASSIGEEGLQVPVGDVENSRFKVIRNIEPLIQKRS